MFLVCDVAGLAATVALVYLGMPWLFTKDAAVAAGVRPLTLQVRCVSRLGLSLIVVCCWMSMAAIAKHARVSC